MVLSPGRSPLGTSSLPTPCEDRGPPCLLVVHGCVQWSPPRTAVGLMSAPVPPDLGTYRTGCGMSFLRDPVCVSSRRVRPRPDQVTFPRCPGDALSDRTHTDDSSVRSPRPLSERRGVGSLRITRLPGSQGGLLTIPRSSSVRGSGG